MTCGALTEWTHKDTVVVASLASGGRPDCLTASLKGSGELLTPLSTCGYLSTVLENVHSEPETLLVGLLLDWILVMCPSDVPCV